MEIASIPSQESPINSPNSNGNSIISCTINNNNGTSTPPLTPKPLSRSEANNNPYPTTFVQADTCTFKHVVQMLTGSSETAKNVVSKSTTQDPAPPPSSAGGTGKGFCIPPKKEGFKLYKRRNNYSLKNELMINPMVSGIENSCGFSPRKPEILSPSILDFPALVLSTVTPLTAADDPSSEEEKAIAEKKFYLHPSPRANNNNPTTHHGDSEPPQLLPLFPVTSP